MASLIPSVFTGLFQLVLRGNPEGEEDPQMSLEDLSRILFPLISPGEDHTQGALKFQPVLIMIEYNLIFIREAESLPVFDVVCVMCLGGERESTRVGWNCFGSYMLSTRLRQKGIFIFVIIGP